MSTCPSGMIKRAAYTAVRSATGKKYRVPATCIEDVGLPGKTPVSRRITVSDDMDLGVYGYENIRTLKAEERHKALTKAIKAVVAEKKLSEHESAVKVMRRINYLMVLNKNTNKTLSDLMERDRNWIMKTYQTNVRKSMSS